MAGKVTDEEILAAVHRVRELEARHAEASARVDALRSAATPGELEERDRWGAVMADLARAVVLESLEVLDRIGMVTAAQLVESVADEEGITADGERPEGRD
ncbi:hypothetical protein [Streptomyces sp. NPDC046261]|uniref:hypothetical protein n=1 Tax=Streptomyces sp. NPDC046261 TaxID=3157200 RepID=UPI0033F72853